ncbi:MAG TPA: FmdB family zinc ribbon protein [Rubrobacteraceae bacterium]|nr:FmdB family zinc ribbon protein [Rubrobacteraceae bacterium]
MPIYEYKCENGHVVDVMQSISDDPLVECVECSAPVRKVLHPVGISFRGSGFYSTDYKSNGAKTETTEKSTAKSGDSGANGASDTGEGGATEKKPEKASAETAKKGD